MLCRADNSLYGGFLNLISYSSVYGYAPFYLPYFGWKGDFGQLNIVGYIGLATSNTTCESLPAWSLTESQYHTCALHSPRHCPAP